MKRTRRSDRKTSVIRVLAQLQKADQAYLKRITQFLFRLWSAVEANPALQCNITKTDGVWVFYAQKTVFYLQFNRKNFALLFLEPEFLLFGSPIVSDLRPSPKEKWSFKFQAFLSEDREFDALARYLERLPKITLKASGRRKHSRIIPAAVQEAAWERFVNHGRRCESPSCGKLIKDNEPLAFDHILPFSKGGSSKVASNIRVLCQRCNQEKYDKFWDTYAYPDSSQ